MASSLFTGDVSENAVPSCQGNSLYFIREHHLMVDLLSWSKSPILWKVCANERNNLSEYLPDCVKIANPVIKTVVSSGFAFIA